MILMSFNNDWFAGPRSFDISPGVKTHLKRSRSGKLWGVRKVGERDKLKLSFEDLRRGDAAEIADWLYNNSANGWVNDADKFLLYLQRKEPKWSEVDSTSSHGFKGFVRFVDDSFNIQRDKYFAKSFQLTFEIISYESF